MLEYAGHGELLSMSDRVLFLLLLFALYIIVQIFAVLTAFIVCKVIKHVKQDKKINRKKVILITLIPAYFTVAVYLLILFVPYRYNDYLVCGMNYRTVEKIYGEFDDVNIKEDGSGSVEYYVDDIDMFSAEIPGRYVMEFDESGKIYDAYYRGFPGG